MDKHTIVIGAGWAGLACAMQLTRKGHKVTIFESSPQAGGRARGIQFGDYTVDNGQHLLINGYNNVHNLLQWLDIDTASIFIKQNMHLHLKSKTNTLNLKINDQQYPLNLLLPLTSSPGLSTKDKFLAGKFFYSLQQNQFSVERDLSVYDLLVQHKQTKNLIDFLWEPIAVATLSTPIVDASAQIFLNVLSSSFTNPRNSGHQFLFPKTDLGNILPTPIEKYLQNNNSKIICNQRVKEIVLTNNQCGSVITRDNKTHCADHVVITTPPSATHRLTAPHASLDSLTTKLQSFKYQQIITVYLEFPNNSKLNLDNLYMVGFVGTTGQWAFNRSFTGQEHIISIVITGNGPHDQLDNNQLATHVYNELKTFYSSLPKPINSKVIREKQAAFSCEVDIKKIRPTNRTAVKNLFLAGDYIDTGFPATLEGAVKSGLDAANHILCE